MRTTLRTLLAAAVGAALVASGTAVASLAATPRAADSVRADGPSGIAPEIPLPEHARVDDALPPPTPEAPPAPQAPAALVAPGPARAPAHRSPPQPSTSLSGPGDGSATPSDTGGDATGGAPAAPAPQAPAHATPAPQVQQAPADPGPAPSGPGQASIPPSHTAPAPTRPAPPRQQGLLGGVTGAVSDTCDGLPLLTAVCG